MFAVIGIEKTLGVGYPFWVAIVMGSVTGAGGGVIRDVFLNEVPLIFRAASQAVAGVMGGLTYWACQFGGWGTVACGLGSGSVVILSRVLAVRYQINLPTLRDSDECA